MKKEVDLKKRTRVRYLAVLAVVVLVSTFFIGCLFYIVAGLGGSLELTPESVDRVVEKHNASGRQ